MRAKVLQPYLRLPEITAVLYSKEGSPQTGGTLHYASKKVHEVYRRHADEFRFGSGSGHQMDVQSTWTRVQFPQPPLSPMFSARQHLRQRCRAFASQCWRWFDERFRPLGLKGGDLGRGHPDAACHWDDVRDMRDRRVVTQQTLCTR